jgi:hypothetical protein
MNYLELRKINVNQHIEKKNGLSYLSWAWAVDTLLQVDPTATWSYGEPVRFGESLMVFCTVNAFGKSMTAQLPVMDFRNKAIQNPDAMSVNTAMQRCLAKAIALHGLGLYIYAGEDLPAPTETDANVSVKKYDEDVANSNFVQAPQKITPLAGALDGFTAEEIELLQGLAEEITFFVKNDDVAQAKEVAGSLTNEEKTALWSLLDSKTRSAMKKG